MYTCYERLSDIKLKLNLFKYLSAVSSVLQRVCRTHSAWEAASIRTVCPPEVWYPRRPWSLFRSTHIRWWWWCHTVGEPTPERWKACTRRLPPRLVPCSLATSGGRTRAATDTYNQWATARHVTWSTPDLTWLRACRPKRDLYSDKAT